MGNKIRVFLRFVFMFIFVVFSFSFSSFVIGAAKDFNIPIYEQTGAGVEKASSSEIIDILFNHDFEIQEKTQEIPADKCSLRAETGSLEVDGIVFENNKLSFNVNYLTNGQGSLTGQKDRERFSVSFDIKEILETSSEKLKLKAEGDGRLNREEKNFDEIIIIFDKLNSKVNVEGSGDLDFEAENMEVTFTEGCFDKEEKFYLITDKGKLGKRRSIEEVRTILDAHPELLDMYEGLGRLYKDYWWAILPTGFIIS